MVVIAPAVAAAGIGLLGEGLKTFGGGGNTQGEFSTLYSAAAQKLAPGATALTIAGTELGALMAPYISMLDKESTLAGQQAYDQFQAALEKDKTQASIQAALGAGLASDYYDLVKTGKLGEISTQLIGPEVAGDLTKKYATAVGDLYKTTLAGETSLLSPTAQAQAQLGLEAGRTRNQQLLNLTNANLEIGKMQEDTRNKMALQRSKVEGDLAMRRFGVGQVGSAMAHFA